MKKFLNTLKQAFPTSKKHLIGLPISIIISFLLGYFSKEWNNIYYHDEWFGKEFTVGPLLGQSLIVLVLGFGVNWTFEYFQQKELEEKPTRIDTLMDTFYFMISCYVGFLITKGILLFI